MAITKETSIDQITVTEDGAVFFREATRLIEDGNVISTTFHRSSLAPGADLTSIPANVVAIAQAAWTPEIIAAYQSSSTLPKE